MFKCKKIFLKILSAILALSFLNSCYPMPTNDDYSIVPLTNNRDFTKEGASPLIPNMDY